MLFAEAKCKLLQSRPWGLPKKTPVKSTDVANQNPHLPHLLILQLPTKEGCNFLYFTFAINRSSPLSVSDRINSTMRSIEVAQKAGLHCMINMLMENWKEIFLNEKKQYDADMEKLEEELAAL